MVCGRLLVQNVAVTSREGRVSRNIQGMAGGETEVVTSREGRVSRNFQFFVSPFISIKSRPARDV